MTSLHPRSIVRCESRLEAGHPSDKDHDSRRLNEVITATSERERHLLRLSCPQIFAWSRCLDVVQHAVAAGPGPPDSNACAPADDDSAEKCVGLSNENQRGRNTSHETDCRKSDGILSALAPSDNGSRLGCKRLCHYFVSKRRNSDKSRYGKRVDVNEKPSQVNVGQVSATDRDCIQ